MTADEQGPDTAAIREKLRSDRGCLKFDPFYEILFLCDALDAARTERDTALASAEARIEAIGRREVERVEAALAERDELRVNVEKLFNLGMEYLNRAEKAEAEVLSAVQAAVVTARRDALLEAADAIEAMHPGEVKNSVLFLRARASTQTPATDGGTDG